MLFRIPLECRLQRAASAAGLAFSRVHLHLVWRGASILGGEKILQAFSTPANRIRTFRILALGAALALAAMIVGIGDNPPGILLAFLAVIAFVLAFVHPWQTPKQYLYLLCTSVLALAVSFPLHNLLEVLAGNLGRSTLSGRLLEVAGGAFFFIALFLCPVVILVAAIGALFR